MIGHGQEELIIIGGMGTDRSVGDGEPFVSLNEENLQKSLYRLKCLSGICNWTTMKQELDVPRSIPVAIPLKDSMVSCN